MIYCLHKASKQTLWPVLQHPIKALEQIADLKSEELREQLQLIFGVRPPQRMQNLMGRWHRQKMAMELRTKTKRSCGALCCCCCNGLGSRLSVSSSSSSSSDIVSSCTEPLQTLSSLAHVMVQEKLSRMIDAERRRAASARWQGLGCIGGAKVIILVAMDKSSYEPRRDFKESMMEVICSKGLEGPKELRSLLNCYISMNPREQRQAILEAFHEVCYTLFSCRR